MLGARRLGLVKELSPFRGQGGEGGADDDAPYQARSATVVLKPSSPMVPSLRPPTSNTTPSSGGPDASRGAAPPRWRLRLLPSVVASADAAARREPTRSQIGAPF